MGCHPERSEGSLSGGPEILRFAQDDMLDDPSRPSCRSCCLNLISALLRTSTGYWPIMNIDRQNRCASAPINHASCTGTHLEAAAQRFFMDTAEGIHVQHDEGFVYGITVWAEGDPATDTLEGLRACNLRQPLLEFV